ncbi:MAG: UDP-N-acetylmuramate--L-alanine ligase [Bacteroidota bacterium]
MNLNDIHKIYFLGIGGIGMSAIARYFLSNGIKIYGYDKTPTKLTSELIAEGIIIHFKEDVESIPEDIDLVIYTPAIPKEHLEYKYFLKNNYQIKKRSEILGMITNSNIGIGIAGTHGKTTISTMLASIMKGSSVDCSAFLGGISKNFDSNLLLSNKSNYVVIEADEFDRSFLQLKPQIAIVSSVDADHLDIYGDKNELKKSFEEYINQIKENGILIIKKGIELKYSNKNISVFTYSLNDINSDYYAINIVIKDGCYSYDLVHPKGIIRDVKLGYPGLHNVENAIAAVSVALNTGVNESEIKEALLNFLGVKRRFDYRLKTEKLVYIDDYAHHPEEIRTCINSVRHLYPDKKLTGVFQPHLYSRTRDFADEFAKSLELLDEVILLDIYPARELPIKGIDSKMLLDKIKIKAKFLYSKDELLNNLLNHNIEVLLTLGAGDIDQLVEPIEKLLT